MAAGGKRRANALQPLLPQLLAWWLGRLHPRACEGCGSDPEPTCPPCGLEEPQPSPVPGHHPPHSVRLHGDGTAQ